jgi:hypothetical protein
LSKQGQQSEKTNQLHDCNSALRIHLISCRVDCTCFATCAIPSKRRRHYKCAIRLFATSALLECQWNILARFVDRLMFGGVFWVCPFKTIQQSYTHSLLRTHRLIDVFSKSVIT